MNFLIKRIHIVYIMNNMIINVIVAIDNQYGIGKDNKLPWHNSKDLKIFKEKTNKTVVIVGKKTLIDLPLLKDRTIFCISRNSDSIICNNPIVYIKRSIHEAIDDAMKLNKDIYVIGGSQIYNEVFKHYKSKIVLHISFFKERYVCDSFFDYHHLENFNIVSETDYGDFVHRVMNYNQYGEQQYLNLLNEILSKSETRFTRNGEVFSDFCKHLKFDLRQGFPLLTTKKMFLKGIIEELLFFIRGDTQSKILEEKGINIWKGNTSREFLDSHCFEDRKEGEMGPMYGYQWRHFNAIVDKKHKYSEYDNKPIDDYEFDTYSAGWLNTFWEKGFEPVLPEFNIDQLKYVVEEIKTNPSSRRILLTTLNPSQVNQGVLWPCHSITLQFYVQDGYLDMFCYNRSSDLFLGLPFNIASSSLLLLLIAKITELEPRYFNLSLGDVHIYAEHVDAVKEQISRIPYIFPKIKIPEVSNLEEIEMLTYKDFELLEYKSYASIKAPMIA